MVGGWGLARANGEQGWTRWRGLKETTQAKVVR